MQQHVDAAGRIRKDPDECGGNGEVAQNETPPIEYGLVRVEILHGKYGEAGYLVDVSMDGGAVAILRLVD